MSFFTAITKRGFAARAALAASLLSSVTLMQSAHALGTAAGTNITNTATVNYTVTGVSQAPVNSNIASFVVDRKVNVTVDNNGGAPISTTPGALNAAARFTVTNTGNGTDSFTFVPTNQAGDDFDVSNMRVYRDNGATPNVFDGGDTLIPAGTPVTFTADQPIVFLVVSDVPGTPINTDDSLVRLTATTTSTETPGVDNPAVVDVVFIDAGRDGAEFAQNQYVISTATLAVVKSASIISDPVNLTGANRKAIPGAIIQYTIVVTNSGSSDATAVALSDNIPANTTYVPGTMTLNAAALTDAALDDAGTFTGTAVNVNAGTVAQTGGVATVTFRVEIVN